VTDPFALRDEIELLVRSLADARAEHDRGELDDEGLTAIERRDGARLADAEARLAALTPARSSYAEPAHVGPRRRPRWLLGVAVACLAVAVGVVVLAVADPFTRPVHPKAPTTTTGKVQALVYEAEVLVNEGHELRALTAYDAVLALSPKNAEALVESGWLRYEYPGLGAHDAAQVELGVAELDRAVRLAPRSAAAHLYWGIVLYQHFHATRAARAQLIRAAQLPEDSAEVALNEAFIYTLSR
jgi:tetratricopeptide (TPR) repeat protein